jgi:hypothetical protein
VAKTRLGGKIDKRSACACPFPGCPARDIINSCGPCSQLVPCAKASRFWHALGASYEQLDVHRARRTPMHSSSLFKRLKQSNYRGSRPGIFRLLSHFWYWKRFRWFQRCKKGRQRIVICCNSCLVLRWSLVYAFHFNRLDFIVRSDFVLPSFPPPPHPLQEGFTNRVSSSPIIDVPGILRKVQCPQHQWGRKEVLA